MKRLFSAACVTLFCSQVSATPVYHPYGPNLTYGAVSNGQTIMSDITNPAAGAATMDSKGGGLRFGILSNIGFGVELGEVDGMSDELDAALNEVDNNFSNSTDATAVQQSIVNINDVMSRVEDDGYAKVFGSLSIPLMPIVVSANTLGGSLVIDANASFIGKLSAFSAPIDFSDADRIAAQNHINANLVGGAPNQTFGDLEIILPGGSVIDYNLLNDSSLVARIGGVVELALGYSTELMPFMGGKVYAGVRGKHYKVTLLQDFERISVEDTGQTSEDYFDDLDLDDGKTSTGFGIDAGVLWVSDHLRAGATITNINEPDFEYNDFDTSGFADPNDASRFSGQYDSTYTMERQITVEAALTSQNKNWVIAGSLDLNEVMDPIGDKYQWMAVSAAYATDSWLLPGIRAGYRVNQAGSELSYLTGGVTLFKSLNLDIAYSPDKVEDDDGEEITRSVIVNLGLELTF